MSLDDDSLHDFMAGAPMRDTQRIARETAALYLEFIASGFEVDQAFDLVRDYFMRILDDVEIQLPGEDAEDE